MVCSQPVQDATGVTDHWPSGGSRWLKAGRLVCLYTRGFVPACCGVNCVSVSRWLAPGCSIQAGSLVVVSSTAFCQLLVCSRSLLIKFVRPGYVL